jgi:hypothetical protein
VIVLRTCAHLPKRTRDVGARSTTWSTSCLRSSKPLDWCEFKSYWTWGIVWRKIKGDASIYHTSQFWIKYETHHYELVSLFNQMRDVPLLRASLIWFLCLKISGPMRSLPTHSKIFKNFHLPLSLCPEHCCCRRLLSSSTPPPSTLAQSTPLLWHP